MIEDFENRNLSLIGHYQNSEEELDGIRKSHKITVNNYDNQLKVLKDHLMVIQSTLDRFVDRAEELELCCKMFSSFEEASNQDDILSQFETKIKKGLKIPVCDFIVGYFSIKSTDLKKYIFSVCEDGRSSRYRYASGFIGNANIN